MDQFNPLDMLATHPVSAYADARSENSDSQPEPLHTLAGDHADDDGVALSQYFEVNPNNSGDFGEEDNPYDDLYKNATHSDYSDQKVTTDETRETTRLVVRNIPMNNGDYIQVLPRDPNRKSLTITWTNGSAVSPGPVLMSEKVSVADVATQGYGLVATEVQSSTVAYANYQFNEHTGAVWLYYPGSTNLYVTVIAVTE